jgi:hypothetical protein
MYNGEGTYLRISQKVGADTGGVEERLYPEPGPLMSYTEYIDVNLIPTNVETNATTHKAQSYFSVRGWNEFMQTMFQYDTPIQTGCQWYSGDNLTGDDGIFPNQNGILSGGHSFVVIGWKLINGKQYLIMVNSWGNIWADNGLAYISQDIFSRLYDGWMTVDIPTDVVKILQKYDKKNVKIDGQPDIYYIYLGKKHLYADELAWWSNGNIFAGGYLIISPEELNIIPRGESINFNWKYNWTPIQIKELMGLLSTNSKRAQELYKKYF